MFRVDVHLRRGIVARRKMMVMTRTIMMIMRIMRRRKIMVMTK